MALSKFKKLTVLLTSFLVGQGSVQLLNLISGFLLLRWLSVEDYAQYSVTFGFQSTFGILIDLGFSGTIIALVGERIYDKKVVGSYIYAGKHFRNLLFWILIPISIITFPLVIAKYHWPWITQLLLLSSIVISLFFQGWASYYAVPLLMHKQLREYYQVQIASAGGRLIINFGFYIISTLFSWITLWINSAVIVFNAILYRKNAEKWIDEPDGSDSKIKREMLSYIAPLIPGIIFTAFQGQISVLLITIFGQTRSIAEVAALSRIAQIFLLLNAFNSVIIEPYIAKVSRQKLVISYFRILSVALAICIMLCGIAFLFPEIPLWVLGSKYQNLKIETSWLIVSSCINYIGGVIWTMSSARKWIYWWHTTLYIVLVLVVQAIGILFMKLDTTLGVIQFSLVSGMAVLVVHIIGSIYGFIYGSRQLRNTV